MLLFCFPVNKKMISIVNINKLERKKKLDCFFFLLPWSRVYGNPENYKVFPHQAYYVH